MATKSKSKRTVKGAPTLKGRNAPRWGGLPHPHRPSPSSRCSCCHSSPPSPAKGFVPKLPLYAHRHTSPETVGEKPREYFFCRRRHDGNGGDGDDEDKTRKKKNFHHRHGFIATESELSVVGKGGESVPIFRGTFEGQVLKIQLPGWMSMPSEFSGAASHECRKPSPRPPSSLSEEKNIGWWDSL